MKTGRKLLQRRHKGAILATCFISMAFVMLLSSLVLLMVQLNDSTAKGIKSKWEQRRVVAELGDKFVATGLLEESDLPEGWSREVAEVTGERSLTLKKGESVVLTVKVSSATGEILLWQTAGFAAE